MPFYALPPFAFGFVYVFLTFFYFSVYAKTRRREPDNLVFAALSATLSGYSFSSFGLYLSSSVAEGRFWLVAQFAFIIPATVLFLHFFWIFLDIPNRRRVWALYAVAAALVLFDLFTPLFLTHEPSVKHFALDGMKVTYFEVKSGPVGDLFLAGAIGMLGVIVHWFRTAPPEARSQLRAVRWGYGVLAVCILNDILVVSGVYRFVYLLECGYFAFALGMAAVLLDRYTTLKNDLERAIEVRTQELQRLGEALAQSERLAATGLLAATLSHEVRNPLAIILSSVDVLDPVVEAPEGREMLSAIRHEVRRISGVTRNLLSLARPSPGPTEALDLNGLVAEFLKFYGRKLAAGGIRVDTAFDKACPQIDGHSGPIHQVLLNLVKNAEEAMPGGGRIWIRTARTEGGVRLDVEDTGPGLKPENLARVFDAFFSTKGGKGNGLGLHITQGIVESMGGTIGVESPPGKGATFWIRLPASRQAGRQP